MKGLFQLLGSIIVSPIVYFVGLAIFAGTVSGISAQSKGQYDAAVAEASVSSAAAEADAAAKATETAAPAVASDAAMAPASALEVTATTMFSDYQDNEIAADGKYKGKALLVSGTVDSISSDFMDKPVVQLSAKPFGFVQASDLPKDVAASLKKGQKITLACTGNGEVIGFPAVSGCTVQ
ncbi:hypothetical protein MRBLST12_003350 [Stenotrophomonas indicatrix]